MKMRLPKVDVMPSTTAIGGGMDLATAPIFAKPGRARLAYNYEWNINGGAEATGQIEPFDGRPSPSAAEYTLLECEADITGVNEGDVLDGATSAASGTVIYVSGKQVAMTKVAGTFADGETLELGATPVATVSNLNPEVDGFLDNRLNKLAADVYQADIGKVPGAGPIRGLHVLNDVVYAWRNNAANSAMAIYKSTSSGWTLVALGEVVRFTGGSTQYDDGDTLTQGGVSATILRVVVETGAWSTSNAAGLFVITGRAGGNYSAGAAGGGGVATLSGAQTATTLAPNGRVRADVYGFTGTAERRLYGCDGVNPEFEFDGTAYVPLTTGMGTVRAQAVRCHRKHLFFAYRSSVQFSAIGNPYSWSPIFGAGEFGTGDTITNLISVGGSTDAAALMVTCQNSLHVLYGTSSADFRLDPLSKVAGAKADSAQDIGGVVALDTPGVMRFPATLSFGNFAWNSVSMDIQPIARSQDCQASVYVPGKFKYRVFFKDGTAISGLPSADGKRYDWSVIDYGRNVIEAVNAEIAGEARTFYGGDDGWVYEADKGRSQAGGPITRALLLHPLTQRSPQHTKSYREMQVMALTESACRIYTSGQFNDDEEPSQQINSPVYGRGLQWDLTNWDQAYWDTAATADWMVPLEGDGRSVVVSFYSEADDELPHTLYAVTPIYTLRKLQR